MQRMLIMAVALLLLCFARTKAQSVNSIADMPLDSAIVQLGLVMRNEVPDRVKVFGIGNVSQLAKESTRFNAALAAYLISRRQFRRLILLSNDWLLRPLNDYLNSNAGYQATHTDTLLSKCFGNAPWNTAEFRTFMHWLKKFNLMHPGEKVQLLGVMPNDPMPPAYYLATYIFPADPQSGTRLSEKWSTDVYNVAMAMTDVGEWYQAIRKNPVVFKKYQQLLLRCGNDLSHAAIINEKKLLGPESEAYARAYVKSNADWMLQNASERTILYGNNEYVARAELVMNGLKVESYGVWIHRKIGDGYFTSLTDFADSATLTLIDPNTRDMKPAEIAGTDQAKIMIAKRSAYFLLKDREAVQKYAPRTIFALIGLEKPIIPQPGVIPADAIFIFPRLTNARLLEPLRY